MNEQWAAYVEESEGCDYTIGCGNKLIPVSATELTEAWREIAETLGADYGFPDRENQLKKVTLVKIMGVMTGPQINPIINMLREDEDLDEDEEIAARRAQYEKLKKEFG